MEKEKLKIIFEFLEEKENLNPPFLWKWKNNIPLIEDDLDVKGDLDFSYLDIASLPEGLKVGGDLSLRGSKITSLPEGLEVGGDLMLYKSAIESLPKDLIVGGSLELSYSKIISLPKGLEVGGGLYIRGTDLKKYTKQQLREMIKPGFIKGRIYD